MTRDNEILIIHFLTRTRMYITVQDQSNIVSFITGYEFGSPTFNFTETFTDFIADKYKIKSGATGWPGQIHMLSKKLSFSWISTFKKTALEFIVTKSTNDLKNELNENVKVKIESLLRKINKTGDPWFNDSWTEEWCSICDLNAGWFKQLWTKEEINVIQAVDNIVKSNKIFADEEHKLPTTELIELKEQYDFLT